MSESPPPKASIVVPAYREAGNLRPLTERLFAATRKAGIDAELIVVDDDSQDGSVQIIDALAAQYPVRIIVRTDQRGLATAVLTGFEHARHDIFVVMDADLQHPPELVPELIEQIASRDCEFVLATRYAGGVIPQDWPWHRRLASAVATRLAKPLAPLSDPMSGFFALRRQTWRRAVDHLSPLGYKIGLELCVKARCTRIAEVPFTFALRHEGESKFGFREQCQYGRHLMRLYRFASPVFFWVAIVVLPLAVVVLLVFASYW